MDFRKNELKAVMYHISKKNSNYVVSNSNKIGLLQSNRNNSTHSVHIGLVCLLRT